MFEKSKNKFKNWTKQDSFYHVLFWLVLYFMQLINYRQFGLSMQLTIPLVNVLFYSFVAYFNISFLFKKYITDGRLWVHFLILLITAAVLTPIKTIILFFLSPGDPTYQADVIDTQFFTFLFLFLVGASATIYRIMQEWLIQQGEKKELESQNLQSELKLLKSQINPHFLFNTLNSLYALTLKKSDQAPEIVLKLSEMMRYMLYECNEKEVFLEKEINYMHNYLELEKLRHGAKMDINFEVIGDLKDQKIAPLLLMPFIENSFKHGINTQLNTGFVSLVIHVNDGELTMNLKNSKAPSLPKIKDKKSGGIGLTNVKRRLQILYPKTHELKIEESPFDYKIFLSLTLIESLP
ncbi:MAG: histidine kinase [Saprospiraceae bacterium]|nr:histidine kinase [Saprospiraceae bacterium]MBK6566602.1 histidine kinase [Saprospiraceae bacterium]MBK6785099.1 histidine kinase [Saprospiraceae bacterium]MBK7525591.1 histidine kinase [Saprospiraceae bacterium]MBK8549327.1 histidine kinase [Saprospiraceae bacterium]